MTIKWSKKDVIAAFSEALAGPGTPGKLPDLAQRIKELAAKNKGVKPQ